MINNLKIINMIKTIFLQKIIQMKSKKIRFKKKSKNYNYKQIFMINKAKEILYKNKNKY